MLENPFKNIFKKETEKPEEVSNNLEKEGSLEREINQELLGLEGNVSALEEDIESLGGEAALQTELERNELLASRWTDRLKRLHAGINAVVMGGSAIGLAWATKASHLFERLNLDLPDDVDVGGVVIIAMLTAVTLALHQAREFLQYQGRVAKANEILGGD